MAATAGAFSFVTRKSGRTAVARAMNSLTDSYVESEAASTVRASAGRLASSRLDNWARSGGVGSPGTGYSCSPDTCSAARDVTSTDRPGASRSSSATIGPAPSTCSKLSSTRSTCFDASHSRSTTSAPRLPDSDRPIAPATRDATSAGSRTVSSGTKNSPSG